MPAAAVTIVLGLLVATAAFAQAPSTEGGTGQARAPSIRSPGPDFADFPNSADVVRPGQYYVEVAPTFQRSETPSTHTDSLDFLLRWGVARDLELRLSGIAVTDIRTTSQAPPASGGGSTLGHRPGRVPRPATTQDTTGFGPIAIGFKYHLGDGGGDLLRPAAGFEFQVQLPLASKAALGGTGPPLPSGSLNVDHTLPANYGFHWNLGFQTSLDENNDPYAQASLQWSVTNNLTRDFQLYVTGATTYPAAASGRQTVNQVGGGFLWTTEERVALYLLVAPTYQTGLGKVGGLTQLGMSFAF